MRPVTTTAKPDIYSGSKKRQREVFELEEKEQTTPLPKRPCLRNATVEDKSIELDEMLSRNWVPTKSLIPDSAILKAKQLLDSIGTDYKAATRLLIEQTGQYCALCDTPLFSGLEAIPILPAEWFPQQAFNYELLLLTCGPCSKAKEKKLTRANESVTELIEPRRLAWPQFVGGILADGALLPFRYELNSVDFSPDQRLRMTALRPDQIEDVMERYRLGYVQVERSSTEARGWVRVNLPDCKWIYARLIPTSTSQPIEKGVANLIDAVSLNTKNDWEDPGWLDRRLELRTLAWLKAFDLYKQLSIVLAAGNRDLLDKMSALLPAIIQSTGFWGVWLSIFHDDPNIREILATCMPGTAPRTWVL